MNVSRLRVPAVLALFAAALSTACHKPRPVVAAPTPISPPPLTLTCSFDRASVIAGSGDTIPVHVRITSPEPGRLAYFWTASSGTLKGAGPDMLWNPHHAPPARYTISVRVVADRGVEAVCSIDVRVEPNPPSESHPSLPASN